MQQIAWEGKVSIHAPVDQVYLYLADLPRHAEWAQSVETLELVQPGDKSGVGARYRAVERQIWQTDRRPHEPLTAKYGKTGDFMCEVRELVPNRRIAWHAWAPYPVVKHLGDYAFELASDGNGGTTLIQRSSLTDNWAGLLISRLVFKTTPEKARAQWAASLKNIKAILEEGE
jgi:uncharacterized membrane protein